MKEKQVVLTGDRPSGKLHLGHYVGSLQQRTILQKNYNQYIMIADVQALTDNFEHPEKIRMHIVQIMLDYLSIGIDPNKTTFFVQSMISEIAELTLFYLNLVTVARLKRNPTVKSEMQQKGYGDTVPAGFLMYPVSQAADITIVKGTVVPVGADQLPMIEQTNEIIRTFNRIYKTEIFPECKAIVGEAGRLPGIDGQSKMSKSLGNAIYLSDSANIVADKVMKMYTDPNHIRIEDPGQIEGNIVFTYLDIFDDRKDEVAMLKEEYQKGGLGDVVLKKRLITVLNNFLDPIRTKRAELEKNIDVVQDILSEGTRDVQEIAAHTMQEVRQVMKLDYPF